MASSTTSVQQSSRPIKRIVVWENGDFNGDGTVLVINSKLHKTWSCVLKCISDRLRPSFGSVKNLLQLDSKEIVKSFQSLKPNGKYVAIGMGRFKPSKNGYKTPEERQLSMGYNKPVVSKFPPKIMLFVLANGRTHEIPCKVFLTETELGLWEFILDLIARNLDMPSGVQYLYNVFGNPVLDPRFLQNGNIYVAVPINEPFIPLDYMRIFRSILPIREVDLKRIDVSAEKRNGPSLTSAIKGEGYNRFNQSQSNGLTTINYMNTFNNNQFCNGRRDEAFKSNDCPKQTQAACPPCIILPQLAALKLYCVDEQPTSSLSQLTEPNVQPFIENMVQQLREIAIEQAGIKEEEDEAEEDEEEEEEGEYMLKEQSSVAIKISSKGHISEIIIENTAEAELEPAEDNEKDAPEETDQSSVAKHNECCDEATKTDMQQMKEDKSQNFGREKKATAEEKLEAPENNAKDAPIPKEYSEYCEDAIETNLKPMKEDKSQNFGREKKVTAEGKLETPENNAKDAQIPKEYSECCEDAMETNLKPMKEDKSQNYSYPINCPFGGGKKDTAQAKFELPENNEKDAPIPNEYSEYCKDAIETDLKPMKEDKSQNYSYPINCPFGGGKKDTAEAKLELPENNEKDAPVPKQYNKYCKDVIETDLKPTKEDYSQNYYYPIKCPFGGGKQTYSAPHCKSLKHQRVPSHVTDNRPVIKQKDAEYNSFMKAVKAQADLPPPPSQAENLEETDEADQKYSFPNNCPSIGSKEIDNKELNVEYELLVTTMDGSKEQVLSKSVDKGCIYETEIARMYGNKEMVPKKLTVSVKPKLANAEPASCNNNKKQSKIPLKAERLVHQARGTISTNVVPTQANDDTECIENMADLPNKNESNINFKDEYDCPRGSCCSNKKNSAYLSDNNCCNWLTEASDKEKVYKPVEDVPASKANKSKVTSSRIVSKSKGKQMKQKADCCNAEGTKVSSESQLKANERGDKVDAIAAAAAKEELKVDCSKKSFNEPSQLCKGEVTDSKSKFKDTNKRGVAKDEKLKTNRRYSRASVEQLRRDAVLSQHIKANFRGRDGKTVKESSFSPDCCNKLTPVKKYGANISKNKRSPNLNQIQASSDCCENSNVQAIKIDQKEPSTVLKPLDEPSLKLDQLRSSPDCCKTSKRVASSKDALKGSSLKSIQQLTTKSSPKSSLKLEQLQSSPVLFDCCKKSEIPSKTISKSITGGKVPSANLKPLKESTQKIIQPKSSSNVPGCCGIFKGQAKTNKLVTTRKVSSKLAQLQSSPDALDCCKEIEVPARIKSSKVPSTNLKPLEESAQNVIQPESSPNVPGCCGIVEEVQTSNVVTDRKNPSAILDKSSSKLAQLQSSPDALDYCKEIVVPARKKSKSATSSKVPLTNLKPLEKSAPNVIQPASSLNVPGCCGIFKGKTSQNKPVTTRKDPSAILYKDSSKLAQLQPSPDALDGCKKTEVQSWTKSKSATSSKVPSTNLKSLEENASNIIQPESSPNVPGCCGIFKGKTRQNKPVTTRKDPSAILYKDSSKLAQLQSSPDALDCCKKTEVSSWTKSKSATSSKVPTTNLKSLEASAPNIIQPESSPDVPGGCGIDEEVQTRNVVTAREDPSAVLDKSSSKLAQLQSSPDALDCCKEIEVPARRKSKSATSSNAPSPNLKPLEESAPDIIQPESSPNVPGCCGIDEEVQTRNVVTAREDPSAVLDKSSSKLAQLQSSPDDSCKKAEVSSWTKSKSATSSKVPSTNLKPLEESAPNVLQPESSPNVPGCCGIDEQVQTSKVVTAREDPSAVLDKSSSKLAQLQSSPDALDCCKEIEVPARKKRKSATSSKVPLTNLKPLEKSAPNVIQPESSPNVPGCCVIFKGKTRQNKPVTTRKDPSTILYKDSSKLAQLQSSPDALDCCKKTEVQSWTKSKSATSSKVPSTNIKSLEESASNIIQPESSPNVPNYCEIVAEVQTSNVVTTRKDPSAILDKGSSKLAQLQSSPDDSCKKAEVSSWTKSKSATGSKVPSTNLKLLEKSASKIIHPESSPNVPGCCGIDEQVQTSKVVTAREDPSAVLDKSSSKLAQLQFSPDALDCCKEIEVPARKKSKSATSSNAPSTNLKPLEESAPNIIQPKSSPNVPGCCGIDEEVQTRNVVTAREDPSAVVDKSSSKWAQLQSSREDRCKKTEFPSSIKSKSATSSKVPSASLNPLEESASNIIQTVPNVPDTRKTTKAVTIRNGASCENIAALSKIPTKLVTTKNYPSTSSKLNQLQSATVDTTLDPPTSSNVSDCCKDTKEQRKETSATSSNKKSLLDSTSKDVEYCYADSCEFKLYKCKTKPARINERNLKPPKVPSASLKPLEESASNIIQTVPNVPDSRKTTEAETIRNGACSENIAALSKTPIKLITTKNYPSTSSNLNQLQSATVDTTLDPPTSSNVSDCCKDTKEQRKEASATSSNKKSLLDSTSKDVEYCYADSCEFKLYKCKTKPARINERNLKPPKVSSASLNPLEESASNIIQTVPNVPDSRKTTEAVTIRNGTCGENIAALSKIPTKLVTTKNYPSTSSKLNQLQSATVDTTLDPPTSSNVSDCCKDTKEQRKETSATSSNKKSLLDSTSKDVEYCYADSCEFKLYKCKTKPARINERNLKPPKVPSASLKPLEESASNIIQTVPNVPDSRKTTEAETIRNGACSENIAPLSKTPIKLVTTKNYPSTSSKLNELQSATVDTTLDPPTSSNVSDCCKDTKEQRKEASATSSNKKSLLDSTSKDVEYCYADSCEFKLYKCKTKPARINERNLKPPKVPSASLKPLEESASNIIQTVPNVPDSRKTTEAETIRNGTCGENIAALSKTPIKLVTTKNYPSTSSKLNQLQSATVDTTLDPPTSSNVSDCCKDTKEQRKEASATSSNKKSLLDSTSKDVEYCYADSCEFKLYRCKTKPARINERNLKPPKVPSASLKPLEESASNIIQTVPNVPDSRKTTEAETIRNGACSENIAPLSKTPIKLVTTKNYPSTSSKLNQLQSATVDTTLDPPTSSNVSDCCKDTKEQRKEASATSSNKKSLLDSTSKDVEYCYADSCEFKLYKCKTKPARINERNLKPPKVPSASLKPLEESASNIIQTVPNVPDSRKTTEAETIRNGTCGENIAALSKTPIKLVTTKNYPSTSSKLNQLQSATVDTTLDPPTSSNVSDCCKDTKEQRKEASATSSNKKSLLDSTSKDVEYCYADSCEFKLYRCKTKPARINERNLKPPKVPSASLKPLEESASNIIQTVPNVPDSRKTTEAETIRNGACSENIAPLSKTPIKLVTTKNYPSTSSKLNELQSATVDTTLDPPTSSNVSDCCKDTKEQRKEASATSSNKKSLLDSTSKDVEYCYADSCEFKLYKCKTKPARINERNLKPPKVPSASLKPLEESASNIIQTVPNVPDSRKTTEAETIRNGTCGENIAALSKTPIKLVTTKNYPSTSSKLNQLQSATVDTTLDPPTSSNVSDCCKDTKEQRKEASATSSNKKSLLDSTSKDVEYCYADSCEFKLYRCKTKPARINERNLKPPKVSSASLNPLEESASNIIQTVPNVPDSRKTTEAVTIRNGTCGENIAALSKIPTKLVTTKNYPSTSSKLNQLQSATVDTTLDPPTSSNVSDCCKDTKEQRKETSATSSNKKSLLDSTSKDVEYCYADSCEFKLYKCKTKPARINERNLKPPKVPSASLKPLEESASNIIQTVPNVPDSRKTTEAETIRNGACSENIAPLSKTPIKLVTTKNYPSTSSKLNELQSATVDTTLDPPTSSNVSDCCKDTKEQRKEASATSSNKKSLLDSTSKDVEYCYADSCEFKLYKCKTKPARINERNLKPPKVPSASLKPLEESASNIIQTVPNVPDSRKTTEAETIRNGTCGENIAALSKTPIKLVTTKNYPSTSSKLNQLQSATVDTTLDPPTSSNVSDCCKDTKEQRKEASATSSNKKSLLDSTSKDVEYCYADSCEFKLYRCKTKPARINERNLKPPKVSSASLNPLEESASNIIQTVPNVPDSRKTTEAVTIRNGTCGENIAALSKIPTKLVTTKNYPSTSSKLNQLQSATVDTTLDPPTSSNVSDCCKDTKEQRKETSATSSNKKSLLDSTSKDVEYCYADSCEFKLYKCKTKPARINERNLKPPKVPSASLKPLEESASNIIQTVPNVPDSRKTTEAETIRNGACGENIAALSKTPIKLVTTKNYPSTSSKLNQLQSATVDTTLDPPTSSNVSDCCKDTKEQRKEASATSSNKKSLLDSTSKDVEYCYPNACEFKLYKCKTKPTRINESSSRFIQPDSSKSTFDYCQDAEVQSKSEPSDVLKLSNKTSSKLNQSKSAPALFDCCQNTEITSKKTSITTKKGPSKLSQNAEREAKELETTKEDPSNIFEPLDENSDQPQPSPYILDCCRTGVSSSKVLTTRKDLSNNKHFKENSSILIELQTYEDTRKMTEAVPIKNGGCYKNIVVPSKIPSKPVTNENYPSQLNQFQSSTTDTTKTTSSTMLEQTSANALPPNCCKDIKEQSRGSSVNFSNAKFTSNYSKGTTTSKDVKYCYTDTCKIKFNKCNTKPATVNIESCYTTTDNRKELVLVQNPVTSKSCKKNLKPPMDFNTVNSLSYSASEAIEKALEPKIQTEATVTKYFKGTDPVEYRRGVPPPSYSDTKQATFCYPNACKLKNKMKSCGPNNCKNNCQKLNEVPVKEESYLQACCQPQRSLIRQGSRKKLGVHVTISNPEVNKQFPAAEDSSSHQSSLKAASVIKETILEEPDASQSETDCFKTELISEAKSVSSSVTSKSKDKGLQSCCDDVIATSTSNAKNLDIELNVIETAVVKENSESNVPSVRASSSKEIQEEASSIREPSGTKVKSVDKITKSVSATAMPTCCSKVNDASRPLSASRTSQKEPSEKIDVEEPELTKSPSLSVEVAASSSHIEELAVEEHLSVEKGISVKTCCKEVNTVTVPFKVEKPNSDEIETVTVKTEKDVVKPSQLDMKNVQEIDINMSSEAQQLDIAVATPSNPSDDEDATRKDSFGNELNMGEKNERSLLEIKESSHSAVNSNRAVQDQSSVFDTVAPTKPSYLAPLATLRSCCVSGLTNRELSNEESSSVILLMEEESNEISKNGSLTTVADSRREIVATPSQFIQEIIDTSKVVIDRFRLENTRQNSWKPADLFAKTCPDHIAPKGAKTAGACCPCSNGKAVTRRNSEYYRQLLDQKYDLLANSDDELEELPVQVEVSKKDREMAQTQPCVTTIECQLTNGNNDDSSKDIRKLGSKRTVSIKQDPIILPIIHEPKHNGSGSKEHVSSDQKNPTEGPLAKCYCNEKTCMCPFDCKGRHRN